MKKVSIIMPVYNAEKYLPKAIESVLAQTYPHFELLLINDQSVDRSRKICIEYSNQDARIVVLENDTACHGPGATRNIGLDHATGDCLLFLDADDWIEVNLLQCAVDRMRETDADIVQFGIAYEQNRENQAMQRCWKGKDIQTKAEIKEDFLHYWKEGGKNLCMNAFRRNLVDSIRFESYINGEDTIYLMDALCRVEKIAYIPEAMYHYRYVEGSTSRHWVDNTVECLAALWSHQKKFLESFQGGMEPMAYAAVAYDDYTWALYQLSASFCPLSFREKRRELLKLREIMGFNSYRGLYPLKMQRGMMKVEILLIRWHLEGLILLLEPLYAKIVRGT